MKTGTRLTAEQKKHYLESGGNVCPFCHSTHISAYDSLDSGGFNQSWQPIECEDCGERWMDIYTLTDIEEV